MDELTLTNLTSANGYVHRSQTDLNFCSSKSNTTNTSSSSNSLAFNEDEEEEEDEATFLSQKAKSFNLGATTTSSSANSINNHITNNSQLTASLTSSLIRADPRSSSSSTTSSSNECNSSSNDIFLQQQQQQKQQQQLQLQSQKQPQQQAAQQHQVTNKPAFLLNALVNGFVQLKLCADKVDFEYIVEVYWSNDSRTYVKRTYDDFVLFHKELTRVFGQFFGEAKKATVNVRAVARCNSTKNLSCLASECLVPVLPSARRPFWVSHLRMAETRETGLNQYVERLLKLPTKIAHSELVLKFFESQTSDPKPARQMSSRLSSTQTDSCVQENYANHPEICMSNLVFEHERDENDENDDSDAIIIDNESGCADNNSNYEYEDELECDRDSMDQFDSRRAYQNYNNLPISNSMIGLNNRMVNREAGLWWDEDEALNELTSSLSFDQFNHTSGKQYSTKLSYDDGSDDLETLKTLEKMLKTSELFRNDANSVCSASSTMIKMSESQMASNKRLSLA